MNLIELKNINKSFIDDNEKIEIFKNLSLEISEDNVYILVGYSGSGKTTLLNIINKLEPIDDGEIITSPNLKISYVTQYANFIEEMSIDKNLRFVALKNNNRDMIYKLAEILNCNTILKKKPRHLSGGEKQRINILRGLLLNPNLLILDEPTASLDQDNKKILVSFINKIQQETKISILLVTHDLDIINLFSKKNVFKIENKSLKVVK
jgi:D-methionine transport system ATP-binding protein